MKGKLLFKEKQGFIGTVTWYITTTAMLLAIGSSILFWMLEPIPERAAGTLISALVFSALFYLLVSAKLYTSIDHQAIYYRFPPFISKERILRKEDIKEMKVRTYKPILEYGGWGYQYRFRSGRALSVTGKQGLQLLTANNKRVLIGTQKPEELRRAVKRLKENWGPKNG